MHFAHGVVRGVSEEVGSRAPREARSARLFELKEVKLWRGLGAVIASRGQALAVRVERKHSFSKHRRRLCLVRFEGTD